MYFESPRKGKGNARYVLNCPEIITPVVTQRAHSTRTSENQVVRPGEQDLYIKLTYSVIREDVGKDPSQSNDCDDKQKKPPKWHMSTLPSHLIRCRQTTSAHDTTLRRLLH